MSRYFRHSAAITKTKRWRALRLEALRRDRFRCVQCGAVGRLEVDHIDRLTADNMHTAYDLDALQVLCRVCHSRKTANEVGITPLSPDRQKWRTAVLELHHHSKG